MAGDMMVYKVVLPVQDPTGEAAAEAQKHLTLYELDLGLNHVVRKSSQPVDNGANLLIPVPGGGDGPGGVLVCAENFIIYSNQVRKDTASVNFEPSTVSATFHLWRKWLGAFSGPSDLFTQHYVLHVVSILPLGA
jgi:hypothetical protein